MSFRGQLEEASKRVLSHGKVYWKKNAKVNRNLSVANVCNIFSVFYKTLNLKFKSYI